jgi:enamine deaminase RidA (YjgF/YER057c/UK114 family)
MDRKIINPWTWQDKFQYVQANQISGPAQVLYCAGQTSVDENGNPVHLDDMAAQITQALDNQETVLHETGFALADVVRLSYYATDVDAFMGEGDVLGPRLERAGCCPASALLGISALGFKGLMVELEATAAK